jgi:hypothetical protein
MMVRPRNRNRYPIRAAAAALLLAALPALAQQPAPPPAPAPPSQPPGQQTIALPAGPAAPGTTEDCGCGVPASPRGPR